MTKPRPEFEVAFAEVQKRLEGLREVEGTDTAALCAALLRAAAQLHILGVASDPKGAQLSLDEVRGLFAHIAVVSLDEIVDALEREQELN